MWTFFLLFNLSFNLHNLKKKYQFYNGTFPKQVNISKKSETDVKNTGISSKVVTFSKDPKY